MSIKKIFFLLLLTTSLAHGALSQQGEGQKQNDLVAVYNPAFRITSNNNFFLTISYLYWQALEKGLDANLFFNDIALSSLDNRYNMNFNFTSGVKAGVGYNLSYDDWTLFAEFLSLQTKDTKKIDQIKEFWNCNLYIFDLNLYRFSHVGTRLSFTPVIAGRIFWLNQHLLKTAYTLENELKTIDLKSQSKWAIGPKIGINSQWQVSKHVNFFLNIDGILAYQRFDIFINVADLPTLANYFSKQYAISPILEGILGFSIGGYLGNNRRHAEISFGYEARVFFNQNYMVSQMTTIYQNSNGSIGNLTMHGLTANFRFDF